MSGSAVTATGSATSPTAVERGSRPAATTRSTSPSHVTTPTSRSPSTTSTARTSGRVRSSPASCTLAAAGSAFGSVSIASRTRVTPKTVLRKQAARVECRRHLADADDEGGAPQGQLLLLGKLPYSVERIAHLLRQPAPDLLAPPEQAPEILHPLEVGDGHAARVGEDVREYRDPALGEHGVCLDGGRPVGALGNHPRLQTPCVRGRHLPLERSEHEHVAGKLEQLGVRHVADTGEAAQRTVLGRPPLERGEVEPILGMDAARVVGNAGDDRASPGELVSRDTADLPEPLHDAAQTGELDAEPLACAVDHHHDSCA